MKKIISLSLIILAFATGIAKAQKTKAFEGTVTYEITYPGMQIDPAQTGQLPTSMTIKVKGVKSRMDMVTGVVSQSVVSDATLRTQLVLLDVMGQKYAIRSTAADLDTAFNKIPPAKIELKTETKDIAGYACKKATVTEEEQTYDIWYTEEIGPESNFANPSLHGIKGMLMEYETEQKGIKSKLTVKTVKAEKIKDITFMQPAEYKELTKEEIKSMFGGGE
ncbi:MAG: DUF4412 domain-containing protein [Bacteroidota bacterium]